jgi:hypothetical protein
MERFRKTVGRDVIGLSGVRWGESDVRDGKLKAGGCAAGGECGLPETGDGVYGPIITWQTCKVLEWLGGAEADTMPDLAPLMKSLLDIYEAKQQDVPDLFGAPPKVTALRFGCIGCPAISNEKITKAKRHQNHGYVHLRRIYDIWDRLYNKTNRCLRLKEGQYRSGPIRLEASKRYFAELLDIQNQSGVALVTEEDEAFIRGCWERKVYPRGWSEADEAVVEPDLFSQEGQR